MTLDQDQLLRFDVRMPRGLDESLMRGVLVRYPNARAVINASLQCVEVVIPEPFFDRTVRVFFDRIEIRRLCRAQIRFDQLRAVEFVMSRGVDHFRVYAHCQSRALTLIGHQFPNLRSASAIALVLALVIVAMRERNSAPPIGES